MTARKQNTPKKYQNPGTGQGKNPRKLCPECLKKGKKYYLKKSSTQYTLDKKRKTSNVLLFCIKHPKLKAVRKKTNRPVEFDFFDII